jgi:serine/threonine protein kinase/WD40 repeat protein
MDKTTSRLHDEAPSRFADGAQTAAAESSSHWNLHPNCDRLGDFQLGPELGRGGMGIVYQATEMKLGRAVALKVLPASSRLSQIQVERFLVEARTAASLDHDHIVPVYYVGEDRGIRYFAMKLIVGENLATVVKTAKVAVKLATKRGAPSVTTEQGIGTVRTAVESTTRPDASAIDLSDACYVSSRTNNSGKSAVRLAKSVALIGQQVAEALHHAHVNGVIHRDIKPSNLMIDGENKVWVTDFGLAQLQSSPSLTRTGDVIGTLRYMSPEQASGRRAFVDNRTDVYSLGVTLYELVTLRNACRGRTAAEILREITFERPTSIRKINPRIPRDFETIINKATERNPTDRYATAKELADDLRRFVEGKTLAAKPRSRVKLARDWLYQRPVVSSVIAACVFVSLCALSTAVWALRGTVAQQRKNTEVVRAAYTKSESRRFLLEAALMVEDNPRLAVELAVRGMSGSPGGGANRTLLTALDANHEVQTVFLQDKRPGELVCSPGGNWLVKCLDGKFYGSSGGAQVFNSTNGQMIAALDENASVSTGLFTPDQQFLLTAGCNCRDRGPIPAFDAIEKTEVTVWTTSDFRQETTLASTYAIHMSEQSCSPIKQRVVLPQAGNQVAVFEIGSWDNVGPTLVGHTAPVVQAIFSPNGQRMATWSTDETLRLWDAETGAELDSIEYKARRLFDVRIKFSPDSRMLLAEGGDGIYVCPGDDLSQFKFIHGSSADFGPDGNTLYYSDRLRTRVSIYNIAAQTVAAECGADLGVERFQLLPRGGYVAGISDKSILIYDAHSAELMGVCNGHTDSVYDIVPLSTDRFASVSWDGSLRFWNVKSDAQQRTLDMVFDPIPTPFTAFSNDNKLALLATRAERVTTLRQTAAPNEILARFAGDFQTLLSDGRLVTADDEHVTLWDAKNARRIKQTGIPERQLQAAFERPGSSQVLLWTYAGNCYQWDTANNALRKLNDEGTSISALEINPATSAVLLGYSNGVVEVIEPDQRTSKPITNLKSSVWYFDFSTDGKRLLITTKDHRIIHWNLEDQQELRTIHSEKNISEAWFANEDQHALAFKWDDGTEIALWSLADGSEQASIEAEGVVDVDRDASRTQFAFAAYTHGAFVWDTATQARTLLTEQTCRRVRFSKDNIILATHANLAASAQDAPRKSERAALMVWNPATQQMESEEPLDLTTSKLELSSSGDEMVLSGIAFGGDMVELATGKVLRSLSGQATGLVLAAFAPDDQIVTVSRDGQIRLIDRNQRNAREIAAHDYPVVRATISGDGSRLLTTDQTGATRVTDLASHESRLLDWTPHANASHSIGPGGKLVVTVDGSNVVKIWDIDTAEVQEMTMDGDVFSAVIAPDGTTLLLLRGAQTPRVAASRAFDEVSVNPAGEADAWLVNLAVKDRRAVVVESGDIVDARFVKSGTNLAVLTSQAKLEVIDLATLQPRRLGGSNRFESLLSSCSEDIVFASTDELISGWDISTGRKLWEIPTVMMDFEWQLSAPGCDWLLVPELTSTQQIVAKRIPVDLVTYCSRLGPRELSNAEQQTFLLDELPEN